MFPMTVTISNPSQLTAVMAALGVVGIEPPKTTPCAAHDAETAKEEAKAPATVKKEAAAKKEVQKAAEAVKPEAASTQPTAETTAAPEPKAEPSAASADAPTYQDAAAAITKLSRAKGRDAAVAVLASFGAAKLPDVKPEQFADVIAAAAKAEA